MHKKQIQVVFQDFNLRQLVAIDRRSANERINEEGVVKIAPEIAFGYAERKRAPFYINLVIRINVLLERKDEVEQNKTAVESFVEGEAHFELRNLGVKRFNEVFDDLDFLDRLADQAYPLALCRLKNLLSELNFKTDFPLSLPPIESRVNLMHKDEAAMEENLS
ncbi:hypothetical protein LK540_10985 [Massilia sp. IC2-278]|uniref:hypothetical protein n=1 Tax=Massilia sp. IC2-278 TaxID=2887200 RepID=UPI001E5787C6|nr:hypothetical protein [Massilia sp. IC2-278]MCC2960947.1 hypothetical protein [Massilia sp. IC2-278]